MSETSKSAAERPRITNLEALTRACRSLRLIDQNAELVLVSDRVLGTADNKVVSGYEVRLPGWQKPVYFNIQTGEVHFDNWPKYDSTHRDVREGRRREGEGGRWGDFKFMLELEAEYEKAVAEMANT